MRPTLKQARKIWSKIWGNIPPGCSEYACALYNCWVSNGQINFEYLCTKHNFHLHGSAKGSSFSFSVSKLRDWR